MVTVSFDPPVDQGDFEILGYRVVSTDESGYDEDGSSDSTTHRIKGLTAGTAYTFSIQALTAEGDGEAFVTGPATPTGVPGAPVMGTATINGSVATVTFSPPASDGGHAITGYVVRGDYVTCPHVTDMNTGSLSLSHAVNNLPGNSPCKFVVQAVNAAGEGPRSELSNPVTYDQPNIDITFPSVQEGDSGTSVATFTFTLSRTTDHPVSFDVATSDGTATAGSDYVARSGVHLVIPAGETSASFEVTVYGDTEGEADETFQSNIANLDGAYRLPPVYGQATIQNDDPLPRLVIDDASTVEGNAGSTTLIFHVGLDSPAPCDVRFTATPIGGTATAYQDFSPALVYGLIAKGSSAGSVNIPVYGDTAIEPDESFQVGLSNVTCATVADGSAIATILNDDAASGPALSIGDVSIVEGDSGTKLATFTVTLSEVQSGPVFFDVATADGSATAGSDYVASASTGLRIAAGRTSKLFTVTINGDASQEADETFFVNLGNAVNASIADGHAVGTIANDDAPATPTLSIADASVSEGDSGTKTLTFTVSLSPAAAGTVSYDIATSDGTATAGSDYVASSLSGQTIIAGSTSKTFAVTINGDTTTESNETFNVTLGNVSGASLGDGNAVGTISNDDGGGGTPSISIADVSMSEGNSRSKQMTFTVKLSAAATGPVTYNIATANGTALAPGDYTAKTSTGQSMSAGATSKTFTVAVKGDRVVEPNETFTVNISAVTGATVGDGQAVGTITNDDAGTLGIARFDAAGLVDDIDDGNAQLVLSGREYAALLLDSAKTLCARSGGAAVVAVEDVENRAVLADLALAAGEACRTSPRYAAVMADGDSRGFLVDAAVPRVLASPRRLVDAAATRLDLQVDGQAKTLSIVLAGPEAGSPRARAARTRALAQSVQQSTLERRPLVLLGAVGVADTIELKPADKVARPVGERMLVNPALLDEFPGARVDLVPQAGEAAAAPVLQLQ
jgi:hypothetical protein